MAQRGRVEVLAAHLESHASTTAAMPMPLHGSSCCAQKPGGGFQFTHPETAPKVLSEEQRRQYEENGFLVVRKLFSQDELAGYAEHFRKICTGEVKPAATSLVMRDISAAKTSRTNTEFDVYKIQDFQDMEELFDYSCHPKILKYVQCFTGPSVRSVHSMLINKAPSVAEKSTTRHPMHQDLYYFPFRPAHRIVASWTAMQRVDRENGCLSVLPGTHKGPLLPHSYPNWQGQVNKAFHGIQAGLDLDTRVHLPMEAGDTVFFHPLLIHGSGANLTNGFRKAISTHYASADTQYIDVRGTLHEPIADEVIAIAKAKYGLDIDYLDVWKLKSRDIVGNDGVIPSEAGP